MKSTASTTGRYSRMMRARARLQDRLDPTLDIHRLLAIRSAIDVLTASLRGILLHGERMY
jgi:hypothetical protein